MTGSMVNIRVTNPGDAAERLLRAVADAVHVPPDRQGALDVAEFWFHSLDAADAEAAVRQALDEAAADWQDYLEVRPVEE